jgi:chromosome segregation ATPase
LKVKPRINSRQLIAVALIAVPWFLRDELAGRMEKRAADAQQVLTEKDQQQEQQQQINDQRDMLRRIGEIQDRLKLVDAKVDPSVSAEEVEAQAKKSDDEFLGDFFKQAGSDLTDNADKLQELMQQIDLPADLNDQLNAVAKSARDNAAELGKFNPDASESEIDTLFNNLSKSQDELVDAYEKLSNVAEQARNRSTNYANIARGVAWVFTAIGTVLMGNWKTLLGESVGEEDDDNKK